MTTERKRWWRGVAMVAVVGCAVASGWFGFVRATAQPNAPAAEVAWERDTTSAPPLPTVTEDQRPPAPPTDAVTPAGAVLPIPIPQTGAPVVPAAPATPAVVVPPAPPVEPVQAGPRAPEGAPAGADKSSLPNLPAMPPLPPPELAAPQPALLPQIPPLPGVGDGSAPKAPVAAPVPPAPADLPKLPVPILPVSLPAMPAPPSALPPIPPMPGVPPLPASPAEPPKALPVVPPAVPGPPMVPSLTQTPELTPPPVPVNAADPPKPDSSLNPTNPGNTLKPTGPVVAPAVPIAPPNSGRTPPGLPVDRPKTPETPLEPTEKFAPVLPTPTVPHRDETMLNVTTSAAFAFLSGALLAAEQAHAFPPLPKPPAVPVPANTVRSDSPTETQLKKDLDEANKKIATANEEIAALKAQVKRLNELVTGRVDKDGFTITSDPGAIEDIKRLRNKLGELEGKIDALKTQTQTALKPPAPVEARPKGTVRVVNDYPVEISMVINDKSYRIPAGTKLDVDVPAGEFTYQLLPTAAASTRSTIKDKETVTLRIK